MSPVNRTFRRIWKGCSAAMQSDPDDGSNPVGKISKIGPPFVCLTDDPLGLITCH